MFIVDNLYVNTTICSCGSTISNEGNTGAPFTRCIKCIPIGCDATESCQCDVCAVEISSGACEECQCIEEELYDGLCEDCMNEILTDSDIEDEEGPLCYGCRCFDDNLIDNLCEDCIEVISIGEQ